LFLVRNFVILDLRWRYRERFVELIKTEHKTSDFSRDGDQTRELNINKDEEQENNEHTDPQLFVMNDNGQ